MVMLCYRDMTFCSASIVKCINEECPRFFGPKQSEAAKKWWGEDVHGPAPVAFSDFSDICGEVVPLEGENA